jgi:hypothetical protein
MHSTSIAFTLVLPDKFSFKLLYCPGLYHSVLDLVDSSTQFIVGLIGFIGPFTNNYQLVSIAFFELIVICILPVQALTGYRLLKLKNVNQISVLFALLNAYTIQTLSMAFICGLAVFQSKINEMLQLASSANAKE